MKPTASYSISITAPNAKDPATNLRRRFNSLVKKTEAARAQLVAWQETMPAIAAQAQRELEPLMQVFATHQRNMVLLLDAMHRDKLKGKRERAKLSELICSIALECFQGGDDAEVQAIYERHGGDDSDAAAEDDEFMEMLATALDVDIDDVRGMRSPDDLLAALGAGEDDDDETVEANATATQARRGKGRKTAAALAREEREAAEAARLKQPVRDIFRKLTSELHPDREPDAVERARKTALMQRVTVAYKANDLLALLQLQLEIAQIGQADLNSLKEEHIKQYNKILQAQLREIETEIAQYEHQAYMTSGGRMHARPTPQALSRFLDADIAAFKKQVKVIAAELEAFRDVDKLKAWLKTWQPRSQTPYDDDGYWF